jgi:thioesterase domain-containing protein/acyl carrier protein
MTNVIESAIMQYWQEILGVDNVSVNDDFFLLGGDSITVLQLVSKIKKDFNISLNASNILNNSTVSQLTQYIKNQSKDISNKTNSSVLCMQKGMIDKYIPLILIHAADGDVNIYSNLVHGMPDKYPIYAVRSPMIDNKKNFESINDMSSYYLRKLEKFGIKPPYIIGGSSFGGIVAYQMAQILHNKGVDVPVVVSIDAPSYKKLPELDEDIKIIEYLAKYMFPQLQINHNELRQINTTEGQINYIIDKASKEKLSIPLELGVSYINAWRDHQRIMNQYVPQPYKGQLVYFSPLEAIPEFPSDQHLEWVKLANGDFQHFRIPGNHSSMNSHPNIAFIIDHLATIIELASSKVLMESKAA